MIRMVEKSQRRLRRQLRRASRPARRVWPRTAEALLGVLSCLVIALVLLTYSPTLARHASQAVSGNKYIALVDGLANPFRNRSLLLQSGLPVYDLKIKRQQYARIESTVEQAKKQGWMSGEQKVEVKAKFLHGGQEYDVSVRLRGDLPPHWEGAKKSWRIKFGKQLIADGDKQIKQPIYFQGKRQINLIIPRDRDFVVAPFVNSLMRKAGLVVPRDGFVVLRINGRLQGLYYEVEHFDKPLLAAQQRPETTVLGQNDRAMHFEQYTKYGTPVTSDAKYDLGTVRRQVDQEGQLALRAIQVLMEHSRHPTAENFRRARAVIDWDKYLQFRVLTTLFNTNHVRFGSDNLKLYYDPSRGLLEPIPWDLHLTRMPKEPGTIDFWNSHGPDELQRSTLLDPLLRLERNRVLWNMLDDGGDRLIADYRQFHDRIRPWAWADVLSTPIQAQKMDVIRRDFEYNVRRVHKVLSYSSANLLYRLEHPNLAAVELAALNFSGVRVHELRLSSPDVFDGVYQLYEDVNGNGRFDEADPLRGESTAVNGELRFKLTGLVLPELKYGSESIDGVHWEFFDTLSGRQRLWLTGQLAPPDRAPLQFIAPQISARASNAVTEEEMSTELDSRAQPAIAVLTQDGSDFFDLLAIQRGRDEFLERNPQFQRHSETPNAVELSGQVSLSGTIIVPEGVPLVIQPGADISMGPAASLVCYGGFTARGTATKRISFHNMAGADRPWGVLAVVRPQETVVLHHTDVSGGAEAEINGILWSGGVAVHHGNLDIASCRLRDMRGEDGLNLKNGQIAMRDCLFLGSASDAVDLDFVTGTVTGCQFLNSLNDGLDISGSKLTVQDCSFENNGDKGMSVGENSHPMVVNCLFSNNQIGISSKDLSSARLAHTTYIGNRLAIEAKRKKPFFGGASAEFVHCVFAENGVLLEEDPFSREQVEFTGTVLDQTLRRPGCRTELLTFHDPLEGDYRLAEPTVRYPASAAWLSSVSLPQGVLQPGIYSRVQLSIDTQ